MYPKRKEKLYINTLMEDPAIPYPSYYVLSGSLAKNEMLHDALICVHTLAFEHHRHPKHFDELFNTFTINAFAIFKERYVVGFFGQKMMYLESNGWKALPATAEVFRLENWLVYR